MLWRSCCVLRVGVIGINFKTADLYLREAIAKSAQSLAGEKSLFFPHPTILLSTCNRTEIYFSAEDLAQAQSDLLTLLRRQVEMPFESHLYSFFGIDCFTHLCRVTTGVDSAILGETEIQRQVKTSYARACKFLALPACMHYLFQKSLRVAKLMRNQLALERGVPSLFSTLWQIAKQELKDLKQINILLVGNSEIHRGFASFLSHKGIDKPMFCTRFPEHFKGERVCDRKELNHWNNYDLISCATQANDFLIQGRGKKRHLIFDLSVPRNVDPRVEKGDVSLFNIEQIDQLIKQKKFMQKESLERLETDLFDNVVRLARLYRDKIEGNFRVCR